MTPEQIAAAAQKLCEDDGRKQSDPYYKVYLLRAMAEIRDHLRVKAAIDWATQPIRGRKGMLLGFAIGFCTCLALVWLAWMDYLN